MFAVLVVASQHFRFSFDTETTTGINRCTNICTLICPLLNQEHAFYGGNLGIRLLYDQFVFSMVSNVTNALYSLALPSEASPKSPNRFVVQPYCRHLWQTNQNLNHSLWRSSTSSGVRCLAIAIWAKAGAVSVKALSCLDIQSWV